ncbi:semaphorin-5A-like protein [Leptotrombidium deliense]|uniref:Semaphorin-5A-like protein n=1 Tax=Leptotrombidium deliense TaxID=299467 RepID=A0A443SGX3_9ACAR|nr:semaphorin-5A-like protein [Leptotrombidium deliense]
MSSGCRDNLIRLSLENFQKSPQKEIAYWPPSKESVHDCKVRGQSEELCHNYIKVILMNKRSSQRPEDIFVCGTNAFKPECSWRKSDAIGTVIRREEGITKSPFSPTWNFTSLLTSEGTYYYAGALDFMGRDTAIIGNLSSKLLRTERVNAKWLNTDANFVSSFEDESYVYFIFRESAVEYINCGKAIYSRIGRVCKNDKGGVEYWNTFVKARLNCSIPGQFPFYFNEIQNAVYLPNEQKFYAIFSTPDIHGSAICSFSNDAISKAFGGGFKYQPTSRSSWEAVYDNEARHQFQCERDISHVDNDAIQMQRKFQLMDESVSSQNGMPSVLETHEKFTHIAVDTTTTKGNYSVDVIFVITKKNKLRRYALWPFSTKACFINEITITSRKDDVVLTMKLLKDTNSLYIGTKYEIIRITLSDCEAFATKDECLRSMDPYCGWNSKKFKCISSPVNKRHWNQNEDISCSDDKNYVWSPWSEWEECNHVSGSFGDRCWCRWQQCEGIGCPSVSKRIEVSNCTRHGGWTDWSEWSPCSTTCGSGYQTRSRSCSNPSPDFGGRNCFGLSKERRNCSGNPPCLPSTTTNMPENVEVKHYMWSDWGQWERCSANCGGGIQLKRRKCLSSECVGCETMWQLCNTHPCKEVKHSTEWSKWYSSNLTNDGMGRNEERFKFTCRGTTMNETDLQVSIRREDRLVDFRDLNKKWSECSVSCGGGVQFLWNGDTYLKRTCNAEISCDEPTQWSKWSPCNNGHQFRFRDCSHVISNCKKGKQIEKVACVTSVKEGSTTLSDNSVQLLDDKLDYNDTLNEIDSLVKTHNGVKVAGVMLKSQTQVGKQNNSVSYTIVVIICILLVCVSVLFSSFLTYYIMRKKSLADERHQRLSLKLFNNSNKPATNAYVSASDFKANNCNNAQHASSLLPSSSFPHSSSPLLYSPIKEATIKRASTIRAKLNSDQIFE